MTIERPVALKDTELVPKPARGTPLEALDDVPRSRNVERYGAGVYASGPIDVDGTTVVGADSVGACITVDGETEYPSAVVENSEQPDEQAGVQHG